MSTKKSSSAIDDIEESIREHLSQGIKDIFSSIVTKGVLNAHATGLKAAAQVVAEQADVIAKDVMSESPKMTAAEAKAASAALAAINESLMARIKSIEVTVSGME